MTSPHQDVQRRFREAVELRDIKKLLPPIEGKAIEALRLVERTRDSGGKILVAGNGGSAAMASHFASELIGSTRTRPSAVSLSADSPTLAGLANDFGWERALAFHFETISNKEDLLFAMTTSGRSENILEVLRSASLRDVKACCLTGLLGAPLDVGNVLHLEVPTLDVAIAQEVHLAIIHFIASEL